MKEEAPRCICGRKTKPRKDGKPAKTCGSRSCSGKLSKLHMQEVLKSRSCVHLTPRVFEPNF
jgi:hypothetical protein